MAEEELVIREDTAEEQLHAELERLKAERKEKRKRHLLEKEKSIPGLSSKDSDVIKANAAKFPTLHPEEKIVCLTAVCFAIQEYQDILRRSREERKTLDYEFDGRTSYLYKEELELIAELEGEEAEKICKKSQEEPCEHLSYECLIQDKLRMMEIDVYAGGEESEYLRITNFYEGRFVDKNIKYEKPYQRESCILENHIRTEMLERRESYLLKMEEAMCKQIDELNKFDEGAWSETKLNQSDGQK